MRRKVTVTRNNKQFTFYLYLGEKYKSDEQFPEYLFTSKGRIFSFFLNRFLSERVSRSDGYIQYHIKDINDVAYHPYGQEISWKYFGDKPIQEGNEIHHLNGCRWDNDISNLVLCYDHYEHMTKYHGWKEKDFEAESDKELSLDYQSDNEGESKA